MMAPVYYRNARMTAQHHILGEIVDRRDGHVTVAVVRVFRGKLKRGRRLTLRVHYSAPEMGGVILDGRIRVAESFVSDARYVEAFLDGDPPDVVMDQIKFLKQKSWRPTGDPTLESFLW
jgi:hypothetical protein